MNSKTIAVLGAGSWGLTLAWLLSEAGKNVCLYTHSEEKAKIIARDHRIDKPLPVSLKPQFVSVTTNIAEAVNDKAVIILCCTAQSMRSVARSLAEHIGALSGDKNPVIVSAVKGLELHSFKRMSQILAEELPAAKIAVLSGPNLAKEILQKLPAAAVIASDDITVANLVQNLISVPNFRLYTNNDVIGVELGGTLKNVIAIAAGAADGFNLGANAKAALVTRGLSEIARLSVYLGAKPTTLAGLAGMGDLLACSSSPLSRNYNLGLQMAKGQSLENIMQETGAVIEGITTTEAACELGKKVNIELPVANLVQAFLTGSLTPSEAITTLMDRPLISE
jgi:glycerol-3-phosphate dehydrogenase (NAD(P)+)